MSRESVFDRCSLEAEEVKAIADRFDQDMSRLEEQLHQNRQNRQRSPEIQRQIEERKSELCRELAPIGTSIGWAAERAGLWALRNLRRSEEARKCYMKHATGQTFKLPPDLSLDSWPPACLNEDWVALEIRFELLTPWYSRDDRILHVLDNPVRKEWVFGVPFMAASSWKGLLRWACRMRSGLLEHLEKEKPFKDWHDPDWIIHLFGHEKAQEAPENLRQGALVFYPTWFDRIGFEVINPHSRARRAGTKPIYYEVVPPGAKGTLLLLYAPLPGMARRDGVQYEKVLQEFLEALKDLLTTYGISAKRTVGWGTAKIETWRADRKNRDPIVENALEQFVDRLIATYSR